MKTTITTLIAAGACVAATAAPASAADLYGSDLNPTHEASSLSCPAYPCTVAQEHFASWESPLIDGPGVITQWKVKLSRGARARLRVMGTNSDGNYYGSETGPWVTGTGGVTTVDTQAGFTFDSYYAGIELESGSVLTDHVTDYAGPSTMVFNRALDSHGYQPDDHADDELLSQVRVEPDRDVDGRGDETQDQCVGFGCGSGGQDPVPTPVDPDNNGPLPPPRPPSTDPVVPEHVDPYEAELAKRPPVKLTVDGRAFFDPSQNKPAIRTYFSNDGRYPVKGSVRLLNGKRDLGALGGDGLDLPTDRYGSQSFSVPAGLVRKLKRGGKSKLTLVAALTGQDGTRATVRQKVTATGRGVTKTFDGTYSGTGGLKFTVTGGLVTDVHRDVQAFCPGINKFATRTLATAEAFPGMVSRRGAFSVKGNFDKDTVSYSGTLKRRGTSSGKLSLFHTELVFGESLGIDQCVAASNWTAKRVRR